MPFIKGQKKNESSGRKKGVVNKKTMDARALAEKLGVDPLEILFHFASRNWQALGYDSENCVKITKEGTVLTERITPEMRLQAAKEAVRYIYPQTKAVELSGTDGEKPTFNVIIEDYSKK